MEKPACSNQRPLKALNPVMACLQWHGPKWGETGVFLDNLGKNEWLPNIGPQK